MPELDGKIALVTGAAQGLGLAIAEVFVREGARVILSDLDGATGADAARRAGGQADFVQLDVTSEAQWAAAEQFARSKYGRLDILVNNAGLLGLYPFDHTHPELWNRLVSVMQTGPYLGIRACLPNMVAQGGGSIINISSTNGIRGMAQSAAYTAAKHGVLGLTRSLALEYAKSGVRINAVCPGAMRTPMLEQTFGEQMESFADYVPVGRLSDPREVAEAVSFVASPRASFMIGAAVVVDGGMTVD